MNLENPKIIVEDLEYVPGSDLGKGYISKVRMVKSKSTGQHFALKVIDLTNVRMDERIALKREIDIQSKLNHPYIIKLYHSFKSREKLCLVQELGEKGNLFSFMRHNQLSTEICFKTFIQILSAVDYIHRKGIIHRDIKPENILLTRNGDFKLCDFGFSAFYDSDEPRQTLCGTKEYLSPEILDSAVQNDKVDIWCMGVLLYELLHKRPPFVSKNVIQLRNEIQLHKIVYRTDIDSQICKIIDSCLRVDPKRRPTAEYILSLPIIINYQKLWMNNASRNVTSQPVKVAVNHNRAEITSNRQVVVQQRNSDDSKPNVFLYNRSVVAKPARNTYTSPNLNDSSGYSSMIFVENRNSGSVNSNKNVQVISNKNVQMTSNRNMQVTSNKNTIIKPISSQIINIYQSKREILKNDQPVTQNSNIYIPAQNLHSKINFKNEQSSSRTHSNDPRSKIFSAEKIVVENRVFRSNSSVGVVKIIRHPSVSSNVSHT